MDYNTLQSDFRNIKGGVFDLDDTLYPPTGEIYAQMAKRICEYVMKTLNLDEKEATVIQKEYYRKYGATVWGLMVEHDVDPEDFTNYVHELDLSSLKKNPRLKKCLDNLPNKKFVFTNGAYQHAERVLERLGLTECFSGIFSIREAEYIPKPALQTYLKMLETFSLNAKESVMFDDSPANILGAKRAGMRTVWISSNVENNKYCSVDTQDFCDYETPDLITFLSALLMDKSA